MSVRTIEHTSNVNETREHKRKRVKVRERENEMALEIIT